MLPRPLKRAGKELRDERRAELERSGRSPPRLDGYGGVYNPGQSGQPFIQSHSSASSGRPLYGTGPAFYPSVPSRGDFVPYPHHSSSWQNTPSYHNPGPPPPAPLMPQAYDYPYTTSPQYFPATHPRSSPNTFDPAPPRRSQRDERYPSFNSPFNHEPSNMYSNEHLSASGNIYPIPSSTPFPSSYHQEPRLSGYPHTSYGANSHTGLSISPDWEAPHRSEYGQQYERSRAFSNAALSQPPETPTDDSPLKVKPKRRRADAEQLRVLNEVLERTMFPTTEERNALAKQLGMTPRSVQIWFQNKRQARRNRSVAAASGAPLAHAPYAPSSMMNPNPPTGPYPTAQSHFEGEILLTGGGMSSSPGSDRGGHTVGSAMSIRRRSRVPDDIKRTRGGF